METGSQELVILSYATVCLHPCVSLNNEKICREISEHKIAVCEKTACLLFEVTTYGLTGPDEIAPRILKECAHQIAPSLYLMFNQSLQLGMALYKRNGSSRTSSPSIKKVTSPTLKITDQFLFLV